MDLFDIGKACSIYKHFFHYYAPCLTYFIICRANRGQTTVSLFFSPRRPLDELTSSCQRYPPNAKYPAEDAIYPFFRPTLPFREYPELDAEDVRQALDFAACNLDDSVILLEAA